MNEKELSTMIERPEDIPEYLPPEERTATWQQLGPMYGSGILNIPSLMTGGAIIAGLGFIPGMIANVVGHFILGAITSLQGKIGRATGLPAYQAGRSAWGKQGSEFFMSLLFIVICLGWGGISLAIGGSAIAALFHVENIRTAFVLITLAYGVIMAFLTMRGFASIAWVGVITLVSSLALSIWGITAAISTLGLQGVFQATASSPIPFVMGIDLAIAHYITGGVLCLDFARFAKDDKQVWGTFMGFFNFAGIYMVGAGMMMAVIAKTPILPEAMASIGMSVWANVLVVTSTTIGVAMTFYSLGLALRNLIGDRSMGSFKLDLNALIFIGFVVGALGGALGLLDHFVGWLLFLLVLVPPIPGIMWADYYIIKKSKFLVDRKWNWAAPVSWLVGGLAGYYIPIFGTKALTSLGVAFVLYLLLSKLQEALGKRTETAPGT